MHPLDLLYNSIRASPDWMNDVPCASLDPFTQDISDTCASCPVLEECREWSKDMNNRFSVIANRRPGEEYDGK